MCNTNVTESSDQWSGGHGLDRKQEIKWDAGNRKEMKAQVQEKGRETTPCPALMRMHARVVVAKTGE